MFLIRMLCRKLPIPIVRLTLELSTTRVRTTSHRSRKPTRRHPLLKLGSSFCASIAIVRQPQVIHSLSCTSSLSKARAVICEKPRVFDQVMGQFMSDHKALHLSCADCSVECGRWR